MVSAIWPPMASIDPVLNVFRMFARMKGKRVEVKGNQNYSYRRGGGFQRTRLPKPISTALASKDLALSGGDALALPR